MRSIAFPNFTAFQCSLSFLKLRFQYSKFDKTMRDRDGSFDTQLHGEVKRIKKNGFSMFGSYKPRYKSLLLTCQKKRI